MTRILLSAFFGILLCTSVHAQGNISLVTPFDKDTIETKNPLLAWFYLDGPSSNVRVFYRIIIVELKDDQSAEAGIIVNRPLVKMDRIQSTQLFYPYDAPALEAGHRYGWQIQKISENIMVDKSEAWEFILPLPEVPQYNKYATLKSKNDGMLYEAAGGKIFFKMEEDYHSEDLKYYIYDEKMVLLTEEITDDSESGRSAGKSNVKHNGSNFYELDLGNMAKAGQYTLLVMDAKNRKYSLRFFVK